MAVSANDPDDDSDNSDAENDEITSHNPLPSSMSANNQITNQHRNQPIMSTLFHPEITTRLYLREHNVSSLSLVEAVTTSSTRHSYTEHVEKSTISTISIGSSTIQHSRLLMYHSEVFDIGIAPTETSHDITRNDGTDHQNNDIEDFETSTTAETMFGLFINDDLVMSLSEGSVFGTLHETTIDKSSFVTVSIAHRTPLSSTVRSSELTVWRSEFHITAHTDSWVPPQETSWHFKDMPRTISPESWMSTRASSPEPQVSASVSSPEPQVSASVSSPEPQVSASVSSPEPQVSASVSSPEPQVSASVSFPEPRISTSASELQIFISLSTSELQLPAKVSTSERQISITLSTSEHQMYTAVSTLELQMSESVSTQELHMSTIDSTIERTSIVSILETSYLQSAAYVDFHAYSQDTFPIFHVSDTYSVISAGIDMTSVQTIESSHSVHEVFELSLSAIVDSHSTVTSAAVTELDSEVIESSLITIAPSSEVIESISLTIEPSSDVIESSSITIEPRLAVTVSGSITIEPISAVLESSTISTYPSSTVIESSSITIEPWSAVKELNPTRIESISPISETISAVIETSYAVTESYLATTETSSVVIEQSSAVMMPTSVVEKPISAVTVTGSTVTMSRHVEFIVSSEYMHQHSYVDILAPMTKKSSSLPMMQTELTTYSEIWYSVSQTSRETLNYIPTETSLEYILISSTHSPESYSTHISLADSVVSDILTLSFSDRADVQSSYEDSRTDMLTEVSESILSIVLSECIDCGSQPTSHSSFVDVHMSTSSMDQSGDFLDVMHSTFDPSLSFISLVSGGSHPESSQIKFQIVSQGLLEANTASLYIVLPHTSFTDVLPSSINISVSSTEYTSTFSRDTLLAMESLITSSRHTHRVVESMTTSSSETQPAVDSLTYSSYSTLYAIQIFTSASDTFFPAYVYSYQHISRLEYTELTSLLSVQLSSDTRTDFTSLMETDLDTIATQIMRTDIISGIITSVASTVVSTKMTSSDLHQDTILYSRFIMTSFMITHTEDGDAYSSHVTPSLETSEDFSQSSIRSFTASTITSHSITTTISTIHILSNFTIFINFDGDCRQASQKKYTGILTAKMLQLVMNISHVEDKNSIVVGTTHCNPNRIPVSFVRADKHRVILHFKNIFSSDYPTRQLTFHSMILNLTGYEEALDTPKRRTSNGLTVVDITIIATASCLCLIIVMTGSFIFARELYHKKISNRFTRASSSRVALRTETLALTNIPAHASDYSDLEMNERCVNQGYSHSLHDDDSSVVTEHRTTFPSSEQGYTLADKDGKIFPKHKDNKTAQFTRSHAPAKPSQSHGVIQHESPGYGLVIGLMGYTKRLERQQKLNQQQKQQFEDRSYYAVPNKRPKTTKVQGVSDIVVSTHLPTSTYTSPPESSIVEDSYLSSPRHLRTLPKANGVSSDSNEELLSKNADSKVNIVNTGSRSKRGIDNPTFSDHSGRTDVDASQVFHF